MMKTNDIKDLFKKKFEAGELRKIGNNVQQSLTIEIQNAHFEVDKPWIIRKPNYDYANREIEWYMSQSLNVNDIPNGAPKMWKSCATSDGLINSNYGWMVFNEKNSYQYDHCLAKLLEDQHTREACMIYNRPSMQDEYNKDGMHDFCCTYAVQCFINENLFGEPVLGYSVFMRSNDAVFGFNNDALWHRYVQKMLAADLSKSLGTNVQLANIIWTAGSLHIYERHFELLNE